MAYPNQAPESLAGVCLPASLAAILTDLEAELDLVWPGWRWRQPFTDLPFEHAARVKWLLLRHKLVSAGTDYPVKIVLDPNRPGKCYAQPVYPDAGGVLPCVPEPARVGPWTAPGGVLARPSASLLAFRLRLPVEVVEGALEAMPQGTPDPEAWVAEWAKGGER